MTNERWRCVASDWNCCCRSSHTPGRPACCHQRWGSFPRFPYPGWRRRLHPPSPAASWGHPPPLEPHHFTALEHYNTTQRTSKTHTTTLILTIVNKPPSYYHYHTSQTQTALHTITIDSLHTIDTN